MRKEIVILIASAMTFIAIAKIRAIDPNRPHGEHEHEKSKRQKYTCPMHPEVVMDHPGNCPKCGMKLVLLKSNGKAQPLHDQQHPHDLFDELSMSLSSRIAGFDHDLSAYFYFRYPGEPALGPPTF